MLPDPNTLGRAVLGYIFPPYLLWAEPDYRRQMITGDRPVGPFHLQ